ncbi:MAG TPA: GvpL/GvpF family gas vesicle protein, partial [Longimicrobiales bacterium]|nr:GvpL/GvpF family gas vesicle protein [Longimicrobiales bacterium]
DRVERQLQDLTWVAEQGIAHERVVAWFVDHTQILPASLFTLYSTGQSLKAAAAARGDVIAAELKRLSGQREWDLKVSYDATALARAVGRFSSAVADLDRELASAAPGRKFLLESKRAELTKTEVARTAGEQAEQILTALEPLTSETRALPLPQSKEPLPVVLHAALLVARVNEEAVVARLEQERDRVAESGISVGFSGPWAPYRFVHYASD